MIININKLNQIYQDLAEKEVTVQGWIRTNRNQKSLVY